MGKEKMSAGRHGEEFWAQESKSNIGFKLMAAQGWSQGQGLGKKGEGRTNFIRAKKKDDNLGLGAKQGDDDSWSAMTGLYNEILQRLAVEGGDHLHEDGGVSKAPEVEDTSKTLQDYIVKKRLYGRFRKAKDTCGYSETDMAAIMGKKTDTTTTAPVSKQVSTRVAAAEKKEEDNSSGVTTITSKMSIRDYFSKKMSLGGSKYSAAGGAGFTEEFQERHYNELTRVADCYSGKMGLGSGRSSDPWENSSSSMGSFAASFSQPSVEDKSQAQQEAEKPAKKKKKSKDKEQPVVEESEVKPAKKSKKAKITDESSSSSSSSSLSSLPSSSLSSEPPKKNKKSKKQEQIVAEEVVAAEQEKPKKVKKTKVTIELVEKKHEEQKEKREEKKLKKDKKSKEAPRACAFCSSSDVPMACGRCQKTFYCGVECQTNHWTTHKTKCGKLQC